MTTIADITNNINSSMTVDQIRTYVANNWDMSVASNSTLLLFSGGVGAMVTETKNLIKSYEVYFDYRRPIQG
jgi:hypothetical protein